MPDPIPRLNATLEGRYRIERELGQGGMATVYLAHDLKHDRKVALKVLKPELAAVLGADRFLQEIKTTASLQHPNILPLFDSGEADSFLFYVMPYVEGETLREKLNRETQLGIDDAVSIATEVADALDYAHRQDVIHRDIKPENILLHEGRPMVADFGIALAVSAAAGGRMTETGLSLGTPHYMSPEQATAEKKVTHRSDLYSLGCVLYEMLTGDPPHTGSSAQAIIMKIVTDEARPVTELRNSVPPNVASAVAMALEKLPADRFETAKALLDALTDPHFRGLRFGDHGDRDARPSKSWASPLLVVVAVLASALAAWGWLGPRQSAGEAPTHVTAALPADVDLRATLTGSMTPNITISPDGREVVFVGDRDGRRLYRLRLDAPGGIEPIPGTEGARGPFYSPSGAWIGFVSGNDLMKIASGGGRPTQLARVTAFRGGTWDADEQFIYYAPFLFDGIYRVPGEGGGEPERVTEPAHDGLDIAHMWPTVLPNGDLLFTSCCSDASTFILEGADPEGTPRQLLEGGSAQYVPSGHLLFMQHASTLLAPYDLNTREVGPATGVLPDAITAHEMFGEFAVSASGSLAYLTGRSEFQRPLVRLYPDGSTDSVSVPPASHVFPITFSPDGRSIVYNTYGGESQDVFTYDLERGGQPQRLTTHRSNDYSVIWGPGATHVTFTSSRAGRQDVYTLPADSRGAEPTLLFSNELPKWPLSWTADGRWLLIGVDDPERGESIWLYSTDADSAWAFIDEPYNEWSSYFSPAGDWLTYARDDVGDRREIWAMAFPDGTPCPISIGGGTFPQWGPDGRSIYYVKADTLMIAEATVEGICGARPRPFLSGMHSVWGLAPDGAYAITVAPEPETQLRLILNWAEELRQKVGRD